MSAKTFIVEGGLTPEVLSFVRVISAVFIVVQKPIYYKRRYEKAELGEER
jgi:hypothetical protein